MKSQHAIILTITFILGAMLAASCGRQKQNPDPETSMSERAGTVQTKQQRQMLRERADTATTAPAYKAVLTDSRQGPKHNTAPGGTLMISLQGDSIHIKGQFSGLSSSYTGSSIHKVLESDKVQRLKPTLSDDSTSGWWEASYRLDETQVNALKSDSLYISVYTEEYDSGEINGQITAVDSTGVDADSTKKQSQDAAPVE